MIPLIGICEIAGAIGLLVPQTRRAAAIGLIVLLVLVFPANAHAALAGVVLGGQPATSLLPRALMQVLFIGLVWWSGLTSERGSERNA